jgi:hypothetical protein
MRYAILLSYGQLDTFSTGEVRTFKFRNTAQRLLNTSGHPRYKKAKIVEVKS